jgi:anti-anti-sigma regulatory factor
MERNMNWPDIEERAELLIRGALERVETAKQDVVLDFSGVRRLDAGGLRALEQLVAKARERSVKVELQGVDVEVYKVLKLMALAGQFIFAA